jgi:hypothetical protein
MNSNLLKSSDLVGVMNDTKWEELRLAMYGLGRLHPHFQIKDVDSDKPTLSDGEWFYHFRLRPYSTIEWCDLRVWSDEQRHSVLQCLRMIHLPGYETEEGFRILGWVRGGEPISYIG